VENIRKRIQTERIIKSEIFWSWIRNKDKGIDYDIRETVHNEVKNISMDKLFEFYNNEIKGRKYIYLIMSDKEKVNFDDLNKLGEVEELTLEKIFGY
ncbi:MAG: hypothetical protein L6407_07775, partial [Candidatus Delongbacteria bacterium]|nr:hypothetical protein [Candidatus Delongbacteria bacterium]